MNRNNKVKKSSKSKISERYPYNSPIKFTFTAGIYPKQPPNISIYPKQPPNISVYHL